jgi:hypothetical protein
MKKIMKILIVLFLIISLECHSVALYSKRRSHRRIEEDEEENEDNEDTEEDDSEPTILEKIQESFISKVKAAKDSKLFNFIFGAVMKILNLLNGNAMINLAMCAVNSLEVYFVAVKFPAAPLTEIKEKLNIGTEQQEIEGNDLSEQLFASEMQENIDMGEETDESEVAAMEAECASKSALLDGMENGTEAEITVSVVEGEGDIKEILAEAKKKLEPKAQNEKKKGKGIINTIIRRAKKISKNVIQKVKEIKKKLKPIFKDAIDKLSTKLAPIKEKIIQLLDKPIVKTLIFFVECALPNIVELIVGGMSAIVKMFTGFQIISLIKNGPKLVKMILDAFKSLRSGFLDDNIQSKYINYGKGTAALIMAILLGTLGFKLNGSK